MRLSVNMLKSQGQGAPAGRPHGSYITHVYRTPPVRSRTEEDCSHKLSDVAACWNPRGMVPVR